MHNQLKQLTAFDRFVLKLILNEKYPEFKLDVYHDTDDPLKCQNPQCHQRKFFLEETGEYMAICSNICAKTCNLDVTP